MAQVGLAGALVITMGGAAFAAVTSPESAEATELLAASAPAGSDPDAPEVLDFSLTDPMDDRAALTSRLLDAERCVVAFTLLF